jgi:hypothetical protein
LPRAHSVSKPTTGASHGPNSVEEASASPAWFRAASITAICIPKQMPKNGTLRWRAKRTASIIPGVPRSPNPPGTRIPFTPSSRCTAFGCSKVSLFTQSKRTRTRLAMPPCVSASANDL